MLLFEEIALAQLEFLTFGKLLNFKNLDFGDAGDPQGLLD